MKKTLLLSLLMVGAVGAFAQGLVNFNNNASFTTAATGSANGHNDRLVYNTDNTTGLSGTNWVANLFYAVGSGKTESALSFDTADSSRIDSTNKTFFATGVQLGKFQPQQKAFPNVDKGGSVTAQVRVWDGSLFGTFGAAIAAGGITGRSAVFDYTVPSVAQPLATDFNMEGLRSFTLQVPEPSTIALGVLGAASLLVVRRRKQ